MRAWLGSSLALLLACSGEAGDASGGSTGASESASGSASTSTSTSGASSGSSAASAGSGSGSAASTSAATGGETSGGGGSGPILLFDGAPGEAVIPGWDPENPRPLMADQLGFGDAWAGASLLIHPDGTVTGFTERIVIWGFEDLPLHYDGPHFGGDFPSWDPETPPPVVAMGTGPTLSGDWMLMTPGVWVDTDGGFVAPGSKVERVVIWSFDGVDAPPSLDYVGPWDGSYVIPGWDHAKPSPLIVWVDTPVQGQWQQGPLAVFSDGTTNTSMNTIQVYGW
ncbi:MAG: hypothetical protein KC420_15415 [Myxococcales bacterium]|nr:hypothetical protein [Myxococcales bacterium]